MPSSNRSVVTSVCFPPLSITAASSPTPFLVVGCVSWISLVRWSISPNSPSVLISVRIGLYPFHYGPHNLRHLGLGDFCSFLDLFVCHFHDLSDDTQIGNDGKGQNLHFGMVGNDNFRNGRHAYGITSDNAEEMVLGRSFKSGSGNADIDTMLQLDIFLFCNLHGH